ncbi:hypothetical protein FA95DRAFT_590339 [Auriscalpium vulgare]|uniref:Uncharacterized protein n=1 Tax=Auriscalpium vulgare TaxID=40419 RepID=A0ACB8REH0_9AGAM|nr:hypothetical protein FA95DRAFT_590339 [Auriscalpium vulgare]
MGLAPESEPSTPQGGCVYRLDLDTQKLWLTALIDLRDKIEGMLLGAADLREDDVGPLAEALYLFWILLKSRVVKEIFTMPFLAPVYMDLKPCSIAHSPAATEVYDWNPVLGVEDAAIHALRYLKRCCAHVAAAFTVVMHPALKKMLPIRVRLVSFPAPDPCLSAEALEHLNSVAAGLTSYPRENMEILVEAVQGRRDLGTLHPEALIIQLAATASQLEAPSTDRLPTCPSVGFEEVARALKSFFTSDGAVFVGTHEEICAPCLWLRQETRMHSIRMGSEQCAVVPWTLPPGVSLEVFRCLELKLLWICNHMGRISR